MTKATVLTGMPVKVGDTILRAALQAAVGGSNQQGMTSCMNGTEFLLFHNEAVSKEFGYDKWEGPQLDGSFLFTGQGVQGDQKMYRGNKGLVDAARHGKPIHLFESKGTSTTYLGQVTLRNLNPETKLTLDVDKNERLVYVFQLDFVGHYAHELMPEPSDFHGAIDTWVDPGLTVATPSKEATPVDAIDLLEFKIQSRFGNWAKSQAWEVKQITFNSESIKGALRPDLFMPNSNLLIEAKASSSRNHVRVAIGQILDYVNIAKLSGMPYTGAILLPELPSADLVTLISSLGIGLIVEEADSYSVHGCNLG